MSQSTQGNDTGEDRRMENEGMADTGAMPRSWYGSLSDVSFRAHVEDGHWVMGVKIDAEKPVVVQNAYRGVAEMEAHAEILDFALALARGHPVQDTGDVQDRAMALVHARRFFACTGRNLEEGVQVRRSQIEIDTESMKAIRQARNGARALMRIAERIDACLKASVDPTLLHHIEAAPEDGATH